jgi:hypothetical protein
MPSVASQAVSMNRTSSITAVSLGGSFSSSISNFTGGFSTSGTTFTLNQASEPYQKMVVLLSVSKSTNMTFNSITLSISGYTSTLLDTVSNSSTNLFMYLITAPRSSTGTSASSFSISINAPTNQSSTNLTFNGIVYFLDGGSGPYDVKTGTNSTSHVLTSGDFINGQSAVFAITSGASITGITTQTSSPTAGAELVSEGTTVNLSTSGIMLSAAFK